MTSASGISLRLNSRRARRRRRRSSTNRLGQLQLEYRARHKSFEELLNGRGIGRYGRFPLRAGEQLESASMKTSSIAVLLGPSILAASCATAPPPPLPAARTVHFTCENGPRLTVVFEGNTAIVTPEGGDPITLPQSVTADGFMYMTPQHSLRGKGDDVTWTVGRMVPIQCKVAS